ncbi:uncharacterized protein EDB91DRAFT_201166 [Suillus paluster]|uniref:uncharacterized protein n=1 Tax=Suillus paluster TaxID=48578 RepID=UPI001B887149|nr:uncharacterized protein EDB91DRAFT_201166 [Suillus paluster]KAG1722780.1 hypothetical protein EDB91DRAFT_201166 [Suillus paluster]
MLPEETNITTMPVEDMNTAITPSEQTNPTTMPSETTTPGPTTTSQQTGGIKLIKLIIFTWLIVLVAETVMSYSTLSTVDIIVGMGVTWLLAIGLATTSDGRIALSDDSASLILLSLAFSSLWVVGVSKYDHGNLENGGGIVRAAIGFIGFIFWIGAFGGSVRACRDWKRHNPQQPGSNSGYDAIPQEVI